MVRNGIKIGLVPFSQLPKLTLCIILILSFFIAMPGYSQCNMGDPKFGESRNYNGSWTEWGNLVNVPIEQ